ncbi:unnamed protein product [Vitrella brassicaformis CCMP3155]|uniref:Uncharacterized protein n=1 Tax=Vitrella brassicaformis (strain CCMP3155) TaxID=1169540 RepID=A0A0G4EBA2_VITBC|nr:unnamed protein product [Vitrella brassicaformis CCMP3155]|eukprot:CEL93235.1 unnamed protein product [Vitrella brassicaformis CCMP3155]
MPWTKQHAYRTSYREMSCRTAVPRTRDGGAGGRGSFLSGSGVEKLSLSLAKGPKGESAGAADTSANEVSGQLSFYPGLPSWSQQHGYRTTYRDMTTLTRVDRMDPIEAIESEPLASVTGTPEGATAAGRITHTANLLASRRPVTAPTSVQVGPVDVASFRETAKEATEFEKTNGRIHRDAGFDLFFENLWKYQPSQAKVPSRPSCFAPWVTPKYLRFPARRQAYDSYASKKDTTTNFIPQSATLDSDKFREFHKRTKLDSASFRETAKEATEFEKTNGRIHRDAGFDLFFENLWKYQPSQAKVPSRPSCFAPWVTPKYLRFPARRQAYDSYASKKDTTTNFIPQSATLDSDKFREFHKRTKLDSGEKVLSHDLPAGYQHYTTPLGHTWRYAPPIIPAARKSNYESILPKYQKGARGGGGGLETGSLF